MLDVYGSLFFAGARTLEANLPSTAGASRPVVVLRLRGRTRVGATLIDALDEYARDLSRVRPGSTSARWTTNWPPSCGRPASLTWAGP